jgi:AcrR family transcriptional regulator
MLENPHRKNDRRVQRTRRLLREALFSLAQEKGYDALTVEDITTRAELGRATFYLHYHDKEALLLESIEVVANDLIAQIDQVSPVLPGREIEGGPNAVIREVFQYASEKAGLFRAILRGEVSSRATSRIHQIIRDTSMSLLRSRLALLGPDYVPPVPLEVFSNYLAGALLSFLTWWLNADQPYSPEEMYRMFLKLFFGGALVALGLPQPPRGEDWGASE